MADPIIIPRDLYITEKENIGWPTRDFLRILNLISQLSVNGDAIADVSEPDASDLPTAIALANANKAAINNILAALRTAGLIKT